jgi:O-antigen biosynthesis protein
MDELNVIIPAYGNTDILTRLLKSFEGVVEQEKIIVRDDASGDKEAIELLKGTDCRVRIGKKNLGFAGNVNSCFVAVTEPYVAIVNSDVYLDSEVNPFISCLKILRNDRDVGVVGIMLLHDDGTIQHGGVEIDFSYGLDVRHRGVNSENVEDYALVEDTAMVTGAFMVMRSQVYREMWGFEEIFGRGYFEDTDFCMRLLKKGYKVIYNGKTFAYHTGSVSFTRSGLGNPRENFEIFKRRHYDYLKKHKDDDRISK